MRYDRKRERQKPYCRIQIYTTSKINTIENKKKLTFNIGEKFNLSKAIENNRDEKWIQKYK